MFRLLALSGVLLMGISCLVPKSKLEAVEADLAAQNKVNAQLKADNDQLKQRLAIASTETEALKAKIAQLEQDYVALKNEAGEAIKFRNVAYMSSGQLQTTLAQVQEEKAKLEATVRALQSERDQAEGRLNNIVAALDKAQAEASDLRINLQNMQRRHDELIQQIDSLTKEREKAYMAMANLATENDQNISELAQLRDELLGLRNELGVTIMAKNATDSRLTESEANREDLIVNIRTLNHDIRSLILEFRELRIAYAQYAKAMQLKVADMQNALAKAQS